MVVLLFVISPSDLREQAEVNDQEARP